MLYRWANSANHERVLIGSTHNSTSTSESILPLAITVVYTPLLEEFHRDTVSRVCFNSGTPFASDWCVRRTRDCDYFSFPMSSYPFYTSWPCGSWWSRTTRISEPLVLGETFLCYLFGLVGNHRKHVLRVTGGEIRSRSVFSQTIRLTKVCSAY